MTLRLILRDRALRRLPGWLALGALVGLMLSAYQQDAVRHGLTLGRHGYQGFRYIAYLPWGLIALYLLIGGVTLRCERLELALPVSYRGLWLARVLALALASLALVGTAAAALLLRNWIEGFQVVGRTQVESLLAHLLAGAFLAVVLSRLPARSLHELSPTRQNGLYLALVWIGVLMVIFLLAGSAPGYALLPAGAAALLALGIYRSLPAAPLIVPQEPRAPSGPPGQAAPSRAAEGGQLAAAGPRSRWFLPFVVARTLYRPWASWLLLPLLAVIGGAAGLGELPEGLAGPWFFLICWLLLSALFAAAATRLSLLDPLPLSRRRLFAWLVLPGLLTVAMGYLAGAALRTDPSAISFREHPIVGDRDLRVPFAYWEIGWDGNPPAVSEPYLPPWEEPYYPPSVTLIRGLPPVLYSPYHVPEGGDPAFLARQVSRAVAAVYGAAVPAEEIERQYLVRAADGSTVVIPFWERGRPLRPSLWWDTAPVVVLLIGLPWLLYLALTVRGGYLSPSGANRRWGHLALVALAALSLLGTVWAFGARLTAGWKLAALSQILLRQAAALLPEVALFRWGSVLAVLTAAYLLSAARFAGAELPATPGGDDRL